MFLQRLLERNPELALAAVGLHQAGRVQANTYLIDLDTVTANAVFIAAAAAAQGLSGYFMAKQYGRNPDTSAAVAAAGLPKAVCVDLQCLDAHRRHGIPIGHIGHLVQAPRGTEDAVLAAEPEVVTLFSIEAATRLAQAARKRDKEQAVLLRVHAPGDAFYFGHGGGFPLAEIEAAAAEIQRLGGLTVAGVTTFPCLLANAARKKVEPTNNLLTLTEAAARLRAAGYRITQVNAPGTTSAQTLRLLAAAGATHVEPGSALHGTTPEHIFDPAAPELPAIVLVSEVSHLDGDDAYIFAAGYYADRVLGDYQLRAAIGHDDALVERVLDVDTAPDGAIHYYCIARAARQAGVRVGDTVVFCFRPQTFVTRARTQAVAGVHAGTGLLPGQSYDQEARPVYLEAQP
ncbi:MAG: alanine racemase [Chloroflexota bacterium]|nr:alanine racemase [Chloroflexota bacterium]